MSPRVRVTVGGVPVTGPGSSPNTGPALDARHMKGADGYTMHGVCLNCGERVRATFQKGYRVAPLVCPRCGCREVTGWKQSNARRWL